jgi:crotonobetainyl-CoA:carnitine CoA-transferase CaiB-like acyl-CoA transferase
VEIEHPLLGKRHTPGIPWRSSGIDQPKYGPAPMLGEHNDYVFNHLLGLSPDEVEELKAGGVIN